MLNGLNIDVNSLRQRSCEVKTFLGSQRQSVWETALNLYTGTEKIFIPFLVSNDLYLDFEVNGLKLALYNLKYNGYELADNFLNNLDSEEVRGVQGLIGIDVLQFIKPFSFVNCMHGTAIQVNQGLVPFGDINHFLTSNQQRALFSGTTKENVDTGCRSPSTDFDNEKFSQLQSRDDVSFPIRITFMDETCVNSVIEPINTYFNPLNFHKTDSDLDLGFKIYTN